MRGRQILPLTGIAAVALVVGSFIVGGDTPDVDAPVREVVSYYIDHDSDQILSGSMLGWAAVFFLFFASALRGALRRAEPDTGGLSALSFAGAIVFAIGLAIFGAISFTLGDVADKLDPAAVQTLHVMGEDFFMPAAMGVAIFLLGTGIAIVKTAALPKWLGWVLVVVGVVAVTPVGFFALLALGLVVVVLSVLLAMRAGGDTTDRPNEGAAAPPT